MKTDEFGNTNAREDHTAIVEWREAALADGWSSVPTYPQSEPETSASTMEKEGFKAMVLARDNAEMRTRLKHHVSKWAFQVQVSLWGPDGLHIDTPHPYDWEKIKRDVRRCTRCGKEDVETKRYSFAGRCCETCLPEMRRLTEQPGWCE